MSSLPSHARNPPGDTVTHSNLTRRSALAFGASGLLPASLLAQGSGYPNRPIELIVPAGAGGGTDMLARAFAEAAKKH